MKPNLTGKIMAMVFLVVFLSLGVFLSAATISGHIATQTGESIRNATVNLGYICNPDYGYDPPDSIDSFTFSDSMGYFAFTSIPRGQYIISANAYGYYPGFLVDPTTGEFQMIEVDADDQEVENITIKLEKDPYQNGTSIITGYVYGNNNQLLNGIPIGIVEAANPDSLILLTWYNCTTGIEGRYGIGNLPVGTYQAVAYNQFTMTPLYYSAPVTITEEGQTIEDVNITIPEQGYSLSGVVKDANNLPLSNANVELESDWNIWESETWFIMLQTETNEMGEYSFDNILPGQYYVRTNLFGPVTIYYPSATDYMNAEPVVISDANITGIDIVIPTTTLYHLSGTVHNQQTGLPIAGVTIKTDNYGFVCPEYADSLNLSVYSAVTDAEGNYTMDVPMGVYSLMAYTEDNTYQTQYYYHATTPYEASLIVVSMDLPQLDFDLTPVQVNNQYSISGMVFDNGVGVTYPVMVVAVSSDEDWDDAVIAQQSNYTIGNLQPGTYYVIACSPYAPPTYYGNSVAWEGAQTIEVNGNMTGIDIEINHYELNGPFAINGVVLDNNRTAIPNVTIALKDENDRIVGYSRTNQVGEYTVYHMPMAAYTVVATKMGLNTETRTVNVNGNTNVDFEMNATTATNDHNQTVPIACTVANYPNPFNPETNIAFSTPKDSKVEVSIYNLKGQLVQTLANEKMVAGVHNLRWNGTNYNNEAVSSGIYLLRVKGNEFTTTHKMALMK